MYVWSDTDQLYKDARIIFTDTEKSNWTWDETAKAYYWHRFFSHQPDLNFDNPLVMEEVLKAMRFWLDMGVDALRMDAIPYLVRARWHLLREPARDARRHQDDSRGHRCRLCQPPDPGRSQSVARRCAPLLRRRRRVPHGLPLSR